VLGSQGDLYLCGLYELDEAEGERNGAICVYKRDTVDHSLLMHPSESGILDMKICNEYVGSVESNGSLSVYRLSGSKDTNVQLEEICSALNDDEGFYLSLDWNTVPYENESQTSIAVSTQRGSIITYKFAEGKLHEDMIIPQAHKLFGSPVPAWIVAYDKHTSYRIVSGGDDTVLRMWDTRMYNEGGTYPIATVKHHEAGVTSAEWHPMLEHIFASGSYDEHVRVWDARMLAEPLCTVHTEGGVWRTKWNVSSSQDGSSKPLHILSAACMHSGSRVMLLDVEEAAYTDEGVENQYAVSVQQIAEHRDDDTSNEGGESKHLAYGIDLLRETRSSSNLELEMVSCSFYDDKLFQWTAEFHI
jgi:diphthamide biosynthesis protein 7